MQLSKHRLEVSDVALNRFPIFRVIERQEVRIRQAHGKGSEDLGGDRRISESGIAEIRHPVEVIEFGMIDAVRALEAEIGRGHAEVLEKRRVVGAAAELAHGGVRWFEALADGSAR